MKQRRFCLKGRNGLYKEIIGRYGISSNDISELSQNIINEVLEILKVICLMLRNMSRPAARKRIL